MKKTIYDNKILIVDDNGELRTMLGTFLAKEGYKDILFAADCKTAKKMILSEDADFIILDVNLPDGDGFSLMKEIKDMPETRDIPVLFLSARDKDADRLIGLGLGADDYMVKPFLPKELMLRMAAILKRSYSYGEAETEERKTLVLGNREVDFEAGIVRYDGITENLTAKELKILETLAKNRGKIVTFDNLCSAVWDAKYFTYENTVMVHMRRLREKVEEDPSRPKWIVTARGIGYKMNPEA
ncbi:MAG: response regulator transcription factor [Eubacteriales bacterium]|nr:response regulator transcription factor [Eubacteriales bacterium]